jgi:hypothetical protein
LVLTLDLLDRGGIDHARELLPIERLPVEVVV